MDEGAEITSRQENHDEQKIPEQAKRKIYSAIFDEELEDEQEEYDLHPNNDI